MTQRRVVLLGGPHDGLSVEIASNDVSVVLHCWDGKPVTVAPTRDPRRSDAVYTQRGTDRTKMVYRADQKGH